MFLGVLLFQMEDIRLMRCGQDWGGYGKVIYTHQ
jgi:hypothetical protein